MDPVIAGVLKGADKCIELLVDGTITSVVERLIASCIRYLDAESQKRWLREIKNYEKQRETERNSGETMEKQMRSNEKRKRSREKQTSNILEYSRNIPEGCE